MTPDERYMLIKKYEKEISYHDRQAFEYRQKLKKLNPNMNGKNEWLFGETRSKL
jgi:DNA-directed RNA polymerase subunit F